jgi:uncharacterized protein with PIN domain
MTNQTSATGNKTQTGITKVQSVCPTEDSLSVVSRRAQDRDAKALEFMRTSPSRYPACPSCGYDLTEISRTAAILREGYEDIDYECEKCGAKEQRRVKQT